MRRTVSFAQVLDETLAAASEPLNAGPMHRSYAAPHVLGFFDFSAPGRQPGAATVPSRAHSAASIWGLGADRPVSPQMSSTPRVQRYLNTEERQALQDFATLGADLAPDFTDTELRAAFRDLARRYHPDRHPESDGAKKAYWSVLFARVHTAYRTLQRANTQ